MSEHGTRTRYVHHGCRCEPCTEANRVYQRAYMREVYYKRHADELRNRAWRNYKPSSYYGAKDGR